MIFFCFKIVLEDRKLPLIEESPIYEIKLCANLYCSDINWSLIFGLI